jgi:hypothetical protein
MIARWVALLGAAALVTQVVAQAVAPAAAQTTAPANTPTKPRRNVPPRITVVPLSHYYRECDFHLAVEHRPSGDVITPQQHCWWALR